MQSTQWIGLLVFMAAVLSLTASAATIVNVYIDENGNGSFQVGAGPLNSLFSNMGPDAGPGGQASVLTYAFPVGVTVGDVGLTEPGSAGVQVASDYVRFNQGSIAFYSDNADGVDALADIPSFLASFYPNLVFVAELGPEGNNGVIYTPTDGQPGYLPNPAFTMVYNIASDSEVPEPGSMLLVGLGLLGLGSKYALRKKKA